MSRKARRKWERHPGAFKQWAAQRMKQGHVRDLAKSCSTSVPGLFRVPNAATCCIYSLVPTVPSVLCLRRISYRSAAL
jgi:hypothetical protein